MADWYEAMTFDLSAVLWHEWLAIAALPFCFVAFWLLIRWVLRRWNEE